MHLDCVTRHVGWLLVLCCGTACADPATSRYRVDAESGAETWEVQDHGVTLSLTQIAPEPARAFYLNRGFSIADAGIYADACVYMTVLRNDSAPGEVNFRVADWRVESMGQIQPPRLLEDWMALWRQRGVSEPARIAFRWAQFPPEQEYAPGEWNQGMLAIGLSADTRFTLIARWQVAGKDYEGRLENVRCAR